MIPQLLNPLLLWGVAAAAVPVVIHLLHRRRFRRQRWAAMEWLLQAAKQNRRRLQVENLLLLVVRTLAVLLLALALTRPSFSDSPIRLGTARKTHLYVLLDNSASLGARAGSRTAFDDALTAVSSLVAGLADGDPVTLVVTNDNWGEARKTGRPRTILRETTDHAAVRRRLGELKPAHARADLVDALKLVEESVPSTGGVDRRVAIVTDLQEVTLEGRRDKDSDPLRPLLARLREKGAESILVPVGRDVPNVAVTNLRPAEDRDVVQGATAVFHAEVRNYSDRPQKVEVRFLVDGEPRGESSQWVNVPARTAGPDAPPAATAQFWTTFTEKDVGVHVIEARIAADAFTSDDARLLAFSVRPRIRVLAVDGDPAPTEPGRSPETYWLVPVLGIYGDNGPISVRQVTEGEFHAMRRLDDWDLVILANVARPAPDEEARRRLEEWVSKGGALFLTVGDRVVPTRWNDEIWRRDGGLLPARLGEPRVDPQSVLRFDLSPNRHPIVADLTHPANAVFFGSPILTGRMTVEGVETEKDTRVALTFDDLAKSPALLDRRVGKGRTLLLATTIDDAWGGLPGSYLLPALVHDTVSYLTSRGDADRNLTAYQPWVRPAPDNLLGSEVTCPDGTQVRQDRAAGADGSSVGFDATWQLGAYRATLQLKPNDLLGRAPPPVVDAFAVNLTPLESDLRRYPPEVVLARWQGLLRSAAESGARTEAVRSKAGEIATPLLAAALACLLAEVLMVQRIGRRRR